MPRRLRLIGPAQTTCPTQCPISTAPGKGEAAQENMVAGSGRNCRWGSSQRGGLGRHLQVPSAWRFPRIPSRQPSMTSCISSLHLSPHPQLCRRPWAGQTTEVPWGLGSGRASHSENQGTPEAGATEGTGQILKIEGSDREKGYSADPGTRNQVQTNKSQCGRVRVIARTAAGAYGWCQAPARPGGADSHSARGSCVQGRLKEKGQSPQGAQRKWGAQLGSSAAQVPPLRISIVSSVLLPSGPQAETVRPPWDLGMSGP